MHYLHDADDAGDVLGHGGAERAVPLLVEVEAGVQDAQHPAASRHHRFRRKAHILAALLVALMRDREGASSACATNGGSC